MARYIDADKLLKKMFPIGMVDDGKYTINAKAVKHAIDQTPTADVVEVVRCKDCIYNEIGSCTHSQNYDEDNYRADYFCADGTPKERGGNNG